MRLGLVMQSAGRWATLGMMKLPINPPGRTLGTENAILSGYGTQYHVRDFEGCLSLKSVVQGSADWETDGRRFVVHQDCYLILNDRQHYTITIDSPKRVRTFCLFFERGFVESSHDHRRRTLARFPTESAAVGA
jgi:hypothetical protein